jgi:PAS domain S-box-containing protein
MEKAKILVVEDDAITAEDLQDRLKDLGYDVPAIAASGEEAIKKAEEIKPDLMLMDIVLKGDMDGIEATEQIHDRFDVPIVYLTAYIDEERLEKTKVTKPYGYIIKPFEDRELRPVIEMALQRHKLEKALREKERGYRNLIESSHELIFCKDLDGHYHTLNLNAAIGLGGTCIEDVEGKTDYELLPKEQADALRKMDKQIMDSGKAIVVEEVVRNAQGEDRIYLSHKWPTCDDEGRITGIACFAMNSTEHMHVEVVKATLKQTEQELAIRNKIAEIFLTVPDEEMYGNVLEVVLEATKSKYGVFGYITEDSDLVIPSLTRDVWDQCKMLKKDIVYPRDTWCGIWGRALLEQKALCTNEPLDVPEGHVPILKDLVVPIIYQRATIGLFQVANKTTDYDERDIHLLKSIAYHTAPILHARLQRDIKERARKRSEEQIKASLREKEVLLKEIHHRVKNNMQVICSLLNLQSRYIKDNEALEFFDETRNRVKSMAIVHEQLYQSGDLARIDIAEYVQSLTTHLFAEYGVILAAINLDIEIKDVLLDVNTAIPCGLIINELITNSLKHAFPDGGSGEIKITMRTTKQNHIELIVSDTGIGFPADLDFQNTDSLGLQIVCWLVDQLGGTIELDRARGTEFRITFANQEEKEK